GKTVTFNINGIMYQRQTNESGIAKLNINLPPGDYVITASYEGYNVANNITVLPVLSASDLKMKYMDGSKFKATLLDGQGKPYAQQKIQFNVNGVLYNKITDSNGQAELNIRLPAGEYIITSSYNGANIANRVTVTS
ncbi:carboxypeptidase-like regulatory domain-containing protein, partial [Methanobrevibacter sp.]|uniref:carboxypeptidase-like regulatory domain-containing protein n=1 Tax=Methanobrevibacter sp. TaxID=66852 RepID=UPI002E76B83F